MEFLAFTQGYITGILIVRNSPNENSLNSQMHSVLVISKFSVEPVMYMTYLLFENSFDEKKQILLHLTCLNIKDSLCKDT